MAKSRVKTSGKQVGYKEKILSSVGEIATNPHAQPGALSFFKPLSPFHSYMGGYLTDDETKKYGESYHRSEHSPYKDNKTDKYYVAKMANGDRAHLGAYANNFERNGDYFRVSAMPNNTRVILKTDTTQGDATLYDEVLRYKHSVCQSIANQVGDKAYIKAGFYNNYPCLMVHIKPVSIYKSAENFYVPADAALEAWSNFLISVYVGYVNFHAKRKNLDIELVRRSSFGFLSPTIAVTGSSIRINVGVIPETYAAVLADGLKAMDQALVDLHNPLKVKNPLPTDCFYGKKEHKAYLTVNGVQKYSTPALSDIFQLLWQQAEKGGKTTLQNIVRTSFSRDGISAMVYQALEHNPHDLFAAMTAGLEWVVGMISIVKGHLTFDTSGEIVYPASARAQANEIKVIDAKFWRFIRQLISTVKTNYGNYADMVALTNEMEVVTKNHILLGVYRQLEILNELILLDVLKRQSVLTSRSFEDGYGSDSEDEETFEDEIIYTKKLIVSNGMRAILATLLVIGYKLSDFSLYVDAAYYEVAYGIKLLKSFEEHAITLRKPGAMTTANAYLYDVNACVTDGVAARSRFDAFVSQTDKKILVLDTTSATTNQMHDYVERFSQTRASTMIFVSSGLKNEQLGADRNAYGTIRLFAKNKPVLNSYYSQIKKKEPAVDSPISHEYRRAVKQLGAVPTSRAILRK